MIVWRIVGNEIGLNGNGACYYATKAEAERARRDLPGEEPVPDPPEKITIKDRKDLVRELNEAMGFGAS